MLAAKLAWVLSIAVATHGGTRAEPPFRTIRARSVDQLAILVSSDMDGAVRSGRRAADEVIASLSGGRGLSPQQPSTG